MKVIQFRIGTTDTYHSFKVITELGDLNNEVQLKEKVNNLVKEYMLVHRIKGVATGVKLMWSLDLTKIQPDD